MTQQHLLCLIAVGIIFILKANVCIIYFQNAVGSNGYLMRISSQVFYDLQITSSGHTEVCNGLYPTRLTSVRAN